MMRPEELDAWIRLLGVWLAAAVAHMLLVLSRGIHLRRATIVRHMSRAALTGILAAGVHSIITQFYVVSPTFGVGVAAVVALLGVDAIQSLTRTVVPELIKKRLGIEENSSESKADSDNNDEPNKDSKGAEQ